MSVELVYVDDNRIRLNNEEFNKNGFKNYVASDMFFEWLKKENCNINTNKSHEDHRFNTFLYKLNSKIKLDLNLNNNIYFVIGQPNTGKSYDFEEKQLFKTGQNDIDYKYLKIPVSGGIGNEYKGLQNTDLAITFDPIKRKLRFGEFLQILMSAIVNSQVPHVVFLDDFHNQDTSSLLSEYTPLFKAQQKRELQDIEATHEIFKDSFASIEEFIDRWNLLIDEKFQGLPYVGITNRISGKSLKLLYPSNFYILGAANFNKNSLNIFADWEDRAEIEYKNPIEDFKTSSKYNEVKDNEFVKCCLQLNEALKEILKVEGIYDSEKYCFGMWKMFDYNRALINDEKQQIQLIKFFFRMIKNTLKFNNKNSLINSIGEELFKRMQDNNWFRNNIEDLSKILNEKDFKEILNNYNIYEDNI